MSKDKQNFNPFHHWRLTKGRPGGKHQMFQTLVIPSVKKKPALHSNIHIVQETITSQQSMPQQIPQEPVPQPIPIYQQYQKPTVNHEKEGIFYWAFQQFPLVQRLVRGLVKIVILLG
jgi:hypothetical protein